jgi:hypothetical protein
MKWFDWPQYLAEPQHVEGYIERTWLLFFVDFDMKCCMSSINQEINSTVNYHEFICGQKVVRCVSMA